MTPGIEHTGEAELHVVADLSAKALRITVSDGVQAVSKTLTAAEAEDLIRLLEALRGQIGEDKDGAA